MFELNFLEKTALDIQLKYFKRTPEQTGTIFYALELAGETGEFLNLIKKYIRTEITEKKFNLLPKIFEELADMSISVIMLKLSLSRKFSRFQVQNKQNYNKIEDLHKIFGALCLQAANWYTLSLESVLNSQNFEEPYYEFIENLNIVSKFFDFELSEAVLSKLNEITIKVLRGDYD